MKIAIDARELRTSTGRYIERLLYYLQQIDSDNQYLVLLKPADIEGWEPTNKKFKKVATRYKEFTFGEQLGLWRQLHKLKPDLVHFGIVQQPIMYQGKVVTTFHDLTTTRFRNPSKNWFIYKIKQIIYRRVNRIVAHKSKAIITPSEYVKDDIARFTHINSRKITVTYESADPITETAEPFPELENQSFLLYVGRPMPHKNLDRLIGAFVLLRQNYPELRLVLAGKKDSIYRQMEKNTQVEGIKNIIFTDFVSEGQLRWLYENTQAYIFPSLSEGFGLPGLEAMTHGAPVVSSKATSLPEIYGDAAEYFDPLNIEEMATVIESVVSNPKKRQILIKKGKEKVKQYSWLTMAKQTLAIYNEVLKKS